jgi:hypothetical protein
MIAGGFIVFTAVVPWFAFGLAYAARTVPVPLAPVAFAAALLLSFTGSAACFFGVSRKEKRSVARIRWAAWSNYSAAFLGIIMLFIV